MDTPNIQLGELIEKSQTQAVNTVKSAVSDTTNSVSGQLGIKNNVNSSALPQNQNQTPQVSEQAQTSSQDRQGNEFTKEMVKDFYAPSVSTSQFALEDEEKVQTEQKLQAVRQKLFQERHNEVYFNAVLNADAPKQQEERPAEKVERQQMEDLQLEQDKKQNELPIAVVRGQTHTEITPGVAG